MSWECRHKSGSTCNKLGGECDPGRRGCVLYGKVYFPFAPEKNPEGMEQPVADAAEEGEVPVTKRHYHHSDQERVSDFLIRHYAPGNEDGNWLQPVWEYAMTHPALDEHSLGRNTLWEQDGEIIALVNYEHRLGEAFLHVAPGHEGLRPAMLDCAELNLRAAGDDGHVALTVYVNDSDTHLAEIVGERGYSRNPSADRPLYEYPVTGNLPEPPLPKGFRLQSMADDNDLAKMDRVLWRGFNHEGDPPESGLEDRRLMQSGPRFRKDLAVVAVEPGGEFACYCGFWYVPECRYGLIEPLATDPGFRRKGLARAAVTEGIRRCAGEGATVVYVGSDQEFYTSLGFVKRHVAQAWMKRFSR